MSGSGRRAHRVAELVRGYLAGAFARDISDPRLQTLTITEVHVPDDLGMVRVGVRLLVGDDDPKARAAALTSLKRARGRLRRGVAPKLALRRVPELSFHYDVGHDAQRRVEELLDEIEREKRERGGATAGEVEGAGDGGAEQGVNGADETDVPQGDDV